MKKAVSGVLVGKTDIGGRDGISAQQPDGTPIRLGGGEIIMNEKASTAYCEKLSEINQKTGGVAFDCDLQKVANTDRASGKMPKDEYYECAAGGGIQRKAYDKEVVNIYRQTLAETQTVEDFNRLFAKRIRAAEKKCNIPEEEFRAGGGYR